MKLRLLTCLVVLTLGHLCSDGTPRAGQRRYHCMCGDICSKAAPGNRCEVKGCNGNLSR